ncbi:MAG: 16S rRNA (cytosine(1402)-N(4))-methyltransferase RsmH [Desulfohalobiaceae bacterium]|nr:16S rRNA (cytosine(1402)-N(4))-methyltransferase RsmH [Desulfohalobiaceae bacterium]
MGEDVAEHDPVLCQEVVQELRVRPRGRYLDGTLGLGGHALGVLRACSPPPYVLGLDRDGQSLKEAESRILDQGLSEWVTLARSRFSRFPEMMRQLGWEDLHGAVLDLGVSSRHLDSAERGFGLHQDGPLDMRLDADSGEETAADLVNLADRERLERIIRDYGEEPMAGRIARQIQQRREKAPFRTTLELAEAVKSAYPAKWRRKARRHPATRTFQALRIAVNEELEELSAFLGRIPESLRPGGRVAVISFHSLEDRLVKWSFRKAARGCTCPEEQMVCTCSGRPRLRLVHKKPITPSAEEIARNRRARSAKMRVAEAPEDR